MHRRLQIGVAEAFDDYSVDVRDVTIDRVRAVDSHDGSDSDGTIERCPEMELVRSVGLSLSRDDSSERLGHEIALRNSSASRIPYAILSQRPSGSASGAPSARSQRDI